jgi:hypothetical protein
MSTPMADAFGANSRSNPSFFASSADASRLTPVTLPPGRLRLATRPVRTGSAALTKTIGILLAAAFAAFAGSLPPAARMTATWRPTRPAASAARRS